jgi:hypothetical protein
MQKGKVMQSAHHRYEIGLAARGLFEIPDAADVRIECRRGSLWLTLDNDPRDIVLEPGESFVTGEHRRALLYALRPACIAVGPAAARGESPTIAVRLPLRLAPA